MSGDRRPSGLLERPVMRERFRTELRSRLLTEAAVVLAPRGARAPFWMVLRPALMAAVMAIVVLAGATGAAASSIPGDPLYAFKRVTEDIQVALTFDEESRMQLLSELADRRLGELAEAARRRPSAAPTATAEYADAVERFANAVDELRAASSEEKREKARAVAEAARNKHKVVLEGVKENLPEDARPAVDEVIEKERRRGADEPSRGGGSGTGGRPSSAPTPRR